MSVKLLKQHAFHNLSSQTFCSLKTIRSFFIQTSLYINSLRYISHLLKEHSFILLVHKGLERRFSWCLTGTQSYRQSNGGPSAGEVTLKDKGKTDQHLVTEKHNKAPLKRKMSSFWRHSNHWLHRKRSFWQLPVESVIQMSSELRHFRFSDQPWAYFFWWTVYIGACMMTSWRTNAPHIIGPLWGKFAGHW